MTDNQKKVYAKLDEMGISYEVQQHPPVYTIEEMDELGIGDENSAVVKNLFLRDNKGKRHFLVVLGKDKKADLKALKEKIGSTPLSFASEERLGKYLGLSKGAVSPMGIINDETQAVEVVMDRDLVGHPRLGVHPNENTATVWLDFEDLKRVIEENGNQIHYIEI